MPSKVDIEHANTVSRTFRDLTAKEIEDPELLSSLEPHFWGTTFGWNELLNAHRVLILSAAGAGKTFECKAQADRLFGEGEPAFFFALEGLARAEPEDLLERPQIECLRKWLRDGHSTGFFFLDSVDELQLSHGNFRMALRKLATVIDGQLHRARIIVTSRPLPLDLDAFRSELPLVEQRPEADLKVETESRFRSLISGELQREHRDTEQKSRNGNPNPEFRIIALTALTNEQISQMIAAQGIGDGPKLIAEIDRKRAWELARRPQELIEICSYWKEHGALGNRAQQVAEDIRRKLRETGARKKHVKVSDAKALDGAERLALALALTRKRTIRFSDLSLDELELEAALDPATILADWTDAERAELLQRPLFGFASYGRVRFHHRSAIEFLAAKKLNRLVSEGHMPRGALFRLMFGERYGEDLVFPSMRAVATWLALENDAVRDEMLRREPEALMDEGDPESFAFSTRNVILSTYVERYKASEWRGVRIPYPQVLRFAAPELSPTVRRCWQDGVQSPEVTELLIDVIQAGRMVDCLDIAETIARDVQARSGDRTTAICALGEMSEPGALDDFVSSLTDPEQNWPSHIKEGVMDALFPKHMTIPQFCAMLGQIEVKKHKVGGASWLLPQLIAQLKLDKEQQSELRRGLADLIAAGVHKTESWPRYASTFRHLSPALALLCLKELDGGAVPSSDLIEAAVLAARFKVDEYGDEKPVAELVTFVRSGSRDWHRPVFLAESSFCSINCPTEDANKHCFNICEKGLLGPLGTDDLDWLIDLIQDQSTPKIAAYAAFQAAMRFVWNAGKLDQTLVATLRDVAGDDAKQIEALEAWISPPKRDVEWETQEAQWAAESAARKAEEEKAVDEWVEWRNTVIADPDFYFANTKTDRIVWDFYEVLQRDIRESGWRAYWCKATIAEHLTTEIAERVRVAFCYYWRTITIPMRSERPVDERNTVWSNWVMGLAGVYAEADRVADWAAMLSEADAELAARYAPVELNGVPPWVKDLVDHQPDAVDRTLGAELSAQLDEAVSFHFPGLISDFSHADAEVQRFFAPRVWAWLSQSSCAFTDETEQARMHEHLERGIDCRLKFGPDGEDLELVDLATSHLKAGLGAPFSLLWLTVMLTIRPEPAIGMLETGLKKLSKKKRYRFSEQLFAALGERRHARFAPDLSDARFTPNILFRLVRIAYAEIQIDKDIDRAGTGTYSPTARDDAQQGRNTVLSALLARKGSDAWQIKHDMRKDPLFAHFRDRLDQLARESAASEAEGPPLLDAEIASIEKYGEAPEADRDGMFRLMLDRLADLQHDIEAHEFSDKSILAGISQEAQMQVYLAKRFQERANGAYRIDREAMVVGAKETDIRLLSVRSDQQAVIEIKLANNGYTLDDLLGALEKQLVGQYMRHDNCRAGCLLITMSRSRTWRNPDNGASLSFGDVIGILRGRAADLAREMQYAFRLEVVGIDLSAT